MDYITNYYKNLSEQLQNKIDILNNKKKMLIEDGGPVLDYLDQDKVHTMLFRFRDRMIERYGLEKGEQIYREYYDDWERLSDENQKYPGDTPVPQFFSRPGRNWGGPVDVPPPPPPPKA